jgi:hypothetical protein
MAYYLTAFYFFICLCCLKASKRLKIITVFYPDFWDMSFLSRMCSSLICLAPAASHNITDLRYRRLSTVPSSWSTFLPWRSWPNATDSCSSASRSLPTTSRLDKLVSRNKISETTAAFEGIERFSNLLKQCCGAGPFLCGSGSSSARDCQKFRLRLQLVKNFGSGSGQFPHLFLKIFISFHCLQNFSCFFQTYMIIKRFF